jgi:uncharacterized membrane protein HdeD (DUF308 family)
METILIILGVIIVIGMAGEAIKAINWGKFLSFLLLGSIALAVLFSFTAEGVLVIVGAYAALLVCAIIFGGFRNIKKEME